MKQFRRAVAAAVLGSTMLATSAFADTVWLNPSAPNTGAAGGMALSGNAHFQTDKATTSFASLLQINGTAAGPAVPVSFMETGFFLVNAFSGVLNSVSGVTEAYNVYALFTITGFGSFVNLGGGNSFFNAGSTGLNVSATLYASPGSASVGAYTPTTTPGSLYGINPSGTDFVLGTANLIAGTNAVGTAQLFANGDAFTNFSALLDFSPAVGTTGATGFWEAPSPFNVDFSTSATGIIPVQGGAGTTYAVSGGQTLITTSVTALGTGSGSGNILFATSVPEPGSLALVGLAMLGAAATTRRYARPAAKV